MGDQLRLRVVDAGLCCDPRRRSAARFLPLALALGVFLASPARADRPAKLVANINEADSTCLRFSSFASTVVEAGSFVYIGSHCSGGELWRVDADKAVLLRSFDAIGEMALVGGQLVFAAQDATNGDELWTSDGTAVGTTLLSDINSGSPSSAPDHLFVVGSRAFFVADDGVNGRELWQSDGTPGGTGLVLDIAAGSASSSPYDFFSTNGVALFSAIIGGTQRLWRSDGTGAGTFELSSVYLYAADHVVDLGGVAVFDGYLAATGAEPWVTDGTIAGTFELADIIPGPTISNTSEYSAIGGRAVFQAGAPGVGFEPWVSDGTIAGTSVLADIWPGNLSSTPVGFTSFGGFLYFSADDGTNGPELWRTHGTPGGTSLVADLNPGASGSGPTRFVESGGLLYFAAFDAAGGYEPWRTDGTLGGTFLLKDIFPGMNPGIRVTPSGYHPFQPTAQGGLAFFVADDGVHGFDVWRSDGTGVGTFAPLDTPSAFTIFLPDILARVSGGVLYLAPAVNNSGTPFTNTSGTTVWFTDGTAVGTHVVAEDLPKSSDPEGFADLGGIAYFSARRLESGRELWRSDGTEAGTSLVKEIAAGSQGSNPTGMTAFAGKLYFAADDGAAGIELWQSDGSEGGTVLFADIEAGAAGSNPQALTRAGAHLFFTAATSGSGRELWATDGVTTSQLADINPGTSGSDPVDLVERGGKLYFFADDGGSRGLWTSDGTPAGTTLVVASDGSGLVHNSSALFFVSADGGNGSEPWTSDGTAGGTMILEDVNPGPASSSPQGLTIVGEQLFLTAVAPASGRELWTSDGATTSLVDDLTPGAGSSTITLLCGAGEKAYFTFGGPAVFVSDGTLLGTLPLSYYLLNTGPVIDAGGLAVFASASVSGGVQPWRSDGTRLGTWSFGGIPGGFAMPNFTVVGQNVFFAATDSVHGNEPWVVSFADLAGCGEIETVCTNVDALGAKLLLKDNADDSRDRFRLVMKYTGSSIFGDPTAGTTYQVCIYDHTLGVPQLAMRAIVPTILSFCDGDACWRETAHGYVFRDPSLSRDGIGALRLTSLPRTKVTVAGRGANLGLPPPAPMSFLNDDPKVTAQVKDTDGSCLSADFSAPALRNVIGLFRDKSD